MAKAPEPAPTRSPSPVKTETPDPVLFRDLASI